ncbi:hypothetical protein N9R68_03160 [Porticoccaceae bacterium]|nr:hypothetical protein [Porticoccaceae bacterium]MDB2566747.1 hypothetical protein [Porticoccaceae bacterium]
MLSSKLDDYWLGLRLKQMDVPASHLLVSGAKVNLESKLLNIEKALQVYMSVTIELTSSLQVFGFIFFSTNLKQPLFSNNLALSES